MACIGQITQIQITETQKRSSKPSNILSVFLTLTWLREGSALSLLGSLRLCPLDFDLVKRGEPL